MRCFVARPAVASVTLLAAGGCGSNSNSSAAGCFSKPAAAQNVREG